MFVLARVSRRGEDFEKEWGKKQRVESKGVVGLAEGLRLRRHRHICPCLTSRSVVSGLAH